MESLETDKPVKITYLQPGKAVHTVRGASS
jgi:hypothetical protein